MEIPAIISFETELTRLQNPSLFHTVKLQAFCTWIALFLAVLATFTSIFNRKLKLVIYRLRKGKSVITPQPLLHPLQDDSDLSDYESDDDQSCSSSSSQESDHDMKETEYNNFSLFRFEQDYRVAGSKLNRSSSELSFSWSDFMNGKGVVKSWDGLGLGLGFEKASESLISFWDLNKPEITTTFPAGKCQIPALSMPSPSVIMSSGFETSRNVALRVFDTRVGRQIPQIFAEWQPIRKKYGSIDSDDVSDDSGSSSLVVRDIRKIGSPVENITTTTTPTTKTWWDDDAVIVDADSGICCFGKDYGGGSVVSRCRNAVFSSLF